MTAPSTEPITPPAGDPPTTQPINPPKPTEPKPPAGDPPKDDKPLGPGGEKALQAERDARKALEKELAALSPLKKLAEALGAGTPAAGGKSEIDLLNERFAEHEKTVADERAARWRAEVANEKGLTPQLAARLRGSTREELAADADELKALIPAAEGSRTPAPDPSQGARAPVDIDAQIEAAEKAGRWQDVIALKRQRHSSK